MTRKLAWIALVCLLVWPLAWSPSALAQGPTPGRVRFLVTGDVHYGGPVDDCTQNPTEDLLNDAHMQALIGRMLASDYDIRGIMIVGDMITGGDSYAAGGSDPWSACLSKQDQWAAYQAARGGYSQYFYDGWGNHEMYGEGDTGPVETLLMYDLVNHGRATPINRGTYHYSWDWEGIHFVQLNVCVSNADCDSGRVDPQSALSWLASDLVSQVGTSGRPVVLFYHMPFTSTPEESHTWFVDNILSNYNVIASFAGHNHPGAGIIGCKYLDDLTSCN
ncbi:MAG: metallophosphoesterase, partial [Chloroflexi bacterium]|nr:metallophosphoesterase [Chloroflexota bacterium]